MQQTICLCCSNMPWDCGLVWDQAEKSVQLTFECLNIFRVNISNSHWEKIENSCPLNRERRFSGPSNCSRCTSYNLVRYNGSAPSVTVYEGDTVTFHQILGDFPEKYYHISLSAALLGVQVHGFEPLPIAHVLQPLHLGGEVALN